MNIISKSIISFVFNKRNMSNTKTVQITKVGSSPPPSIPTKTEQSMGGKKPLKSILKKTQRIKDVKDPAKPTPLKPGMKRHTLKLLTSKGHKKLKKTLKKKLHKLKKSELDKLVQDSNMKLNPNTPPEIARKIVSNAISAGFVSSP